MKKWLLVSFCALFGVAMMQAQTLFKNDGGQVVVQSGAVLTIEGGIENTNTGTFDNEGTVIVEGDFVNDGTSSFNSTQGSLVRFEGADTSFVTSSGTVFDDVEIAKNAGSAVKLVDAMTVGDSLTFVNSNHILLGSSSLIIQDTGLIEGFGSDRFVVTDGAGYLTKEGVAVGSPFTFPVGYTSTTYNPATLTPDGAHVSDNFSVRVLENAYEDGLIGTQYTEDVVNATWEINEETATGSDVDMKLVWEMGDEALNFDPTESGISRYDGADWDMLYAHTGAAADEGGGYWSRTRDSITEFSPFIVGGEKAAHQLALDLKVYLQGAYDSGTGMMTDVLRDSAFIPTIEPYTGAPYSFPHEAFGGDEMVASANDFDNPSDGDDVVDWAVVTLRSPSDSNTVLASKSALLQRDGDIVDLDGVSVLGIPGMPDGDYIVGVHHRNHLAIRSSTHLTLSSSTVSYDFTSSLSQAYANPNAPYNLFTQMKELDTDVWGMWGGDATSNSETASSGSQGDRLEVLSVTGNLSNIIPGYLHTDVNLNGVTASSGSTGDRLFILSVTQNLSNIVYSHDQ